MGAKVRSGVRSTALKEKGKLDWSRDLHPLDEGPGASAVKRPDAARLRRSFLRIPPFPGAVPQSFAQLSWMTDIQADLADLVRTLRVGGTYWGAQPKLPSGHVLVRTAAAARAVSARFEGGINVLWTDEPARESASNWTAVLHGDCDPWHVLSSASAVVVEANDELRVIAALLGVPRFIYRPGEEQLEACATEAGWLLVQALSATTFRNPFTGDPMSIRDAIELCGFWRELIDSNRALAGGIGFAFWKHKHVAPLLWGGSNAFKFLRSAREVERGAELAVWQAKVRPAAIAQLKRNRVNLIEVEDGFLRSQGLGADCIPPLSITVDRLGAHFDPSQESELERLLQSGSFDAHLLARAAELRRAIVHEGIGKYERGTVQLERPTAHRRVILVPGQVEDDRAVQSGGCGLVSNLELLRRVREQAPDAYILYKPHPDVVAGHRRGAIPERVCLHQADEVMAGNAIASVIAMVDEVHVNTSLAGFEALLRGKPVTTYGVPFYAGWGLTRDLGPVPERRSAIRSVDELVAAALLLYPRYLDPLTGLPCPAEIVVQRLTTEVVAPSGMFVGMRRVQGRLMRRLRDLVQ